MSARTILWLAVVLVAAAPAAAQEPPPPIGPIAIDVSGLAPGLPDGSALAPSRGLDPSQVPGRAIGVEIGAHVYPFAVGVATVGVGGQLLLGRGHASPAAALAPATAHIVALTPQLSLNFGSGNGWSYLSAGIGRARLSLQMDGAAALPVDDTWVMITDYGGGARWFTRAHLAFHFDVRWRSMAPSPAQAAVPQQPRINLFTLAVGVSVR
jgi:hypothetical protein